MTYGLPVKRWSYSSQPGAGLLARLREARQLLAMVQRGSEPHVARTLRAFKETRRLVEAVTGMQLERKRILEIGPGQQLGILRCFSQGNDVTGIDTDVIIQRMTLRGLVRILHSNSAVRVLKTVVRKALGHDARFEELLAAALGVSGFAPLRVLRMDAACMDFPDASFDLACSYSVFEHLERPEAVLREIVRILAPGGGVYIVTHLWTSHSGHHDPRILSEELRPPYWPHLRPGLKDRVQYSTYCNRIRLPEWRALFSRAMPGVQFSFEAEPALALPLQELRSAGELADYADEELLNVCLVSVWQKPTA